jgi:hypothetical protein
VICDLLARLLLNKELEEREKSLMMNKKITKDNS